MSIYYQPGDYQCEIVGQFIGESKEKKTPFVGLQFMPDGGQYERTLCLYLTEKTKARTFDTLRQLGWQTDKISDLCPTTGPRVSLAGATIELRCSTEVYNGDQREKWGLAIAEREPVESNPELAKRLDNLFGKEIRKSATAKATKKSTNAEGNGASAASATTNTATAEQDDDIPF